MIKLIIWLIVFIFNLLITLPCAGSIYVKNLHKKCVSNQQKCYLNCAVEFQKEITPETIGLDALACADTCLQEYSECEKALERLRYLYDSKPLPEEDTNIYKKPIGE